MQRKRVCRVLLVLMLLTVASAPHVGAWLMQKQIHWDAQNPFGPESGVWVSTVVCTGAGIGVLSSLRPVEAAALPKAAADSLAQVLFYWSGSDPFTLRDLVSGGVMVFGRPGSGKTTGSGQEIGRGLLLRVPNSGGLIHASKPEDRVFWTELFAKAGRLRDLLVFAPGEMLRFNPLAEAVRAGADTREITQFFLTVGETLGRGTRSGGSNESFWQGLKERTIYNAVGILRMATGTVTAPDLQRFIIGAAQSIEELSSEEWRKGFHNQCLARAFYANKTSVERFDYQQQVDFFLKELPAMDAKPRSSGLADVLNLLHVFNTGEVRLLLSGETNVSPALMEKGKWILVDAPVQSLGATGTFINAAWKYATERHILRRFAQHDAPVIVIWSDEFQNLVNSYDATFLAECRSHRGALVALTQSIHSIHAAMGGDAGEREASALLSCFGTKVFHPLGDDQTAAYAGSLIGPRLTTFVGGSLPPADGMFDTLMGQSKYTGSFSQSYEQALQNNEFMTGRCGGPANGFLTDAIVIRSGEPFSNGQNWLRVTFSQKG